VICEKRRSFVRFNVTIRLLLKNQKVSWRKFVLVNTQGPENKEHALEQVDVFMYQAIS